MMNYQKMGIFALFALTLLILYSLSAMLLPFIAAFIGAYSLNSFVSKLEKLNFSRTFSTSIVMLLFIIFLFALLMVLIPYIHEKLFSLSTEVPALTDNVLGSLSPVLEKLSKDFGTPSINQIKEQVIAHLGGMAGLILHFMLNIVSSGFAIANLISLLVLTPILLFYFLKDWPRFLKSAANLIPKKSQPTVFCYFHAIDEALSSYAKGQLAVMVVLMILYSVSLSIIGFEEALFVGILTGFLAFIPYLGALIGLLLALILGFLHFTGWLQIILILVVFAIMNFIEGNFLTPKLIGKKVGLHPIWIIFSLLAFGTWFGFLGVIIALPFAASLSVVVRLLIERYKHTHFYLDLPPSAKEGHK